MRTAGVVLAWVAGAALGAVAAGAAEPPVNVVAEQVRAIAADVDAKDTAALLVFVVDDAGDPLDSVPISVLEGGREIGRAESDARGRALLRLAFTGQVAVRATESGLVPGEARGVELRKAGLTAVVLPLEDVASKLAK